MSPTIKISISVGLFFLLLYGLSATTTPTGIADADELTATSFFMSVPHPPGFPLFTIVGHTGIKLLSGFTNTAHAANLLSSFYQAIAVAIFFIVATKLTLALSPKKNYFIALAATCLFGFSYLIWNYAAIYEITSFTALLSMITILAALSWYQAKPEQQLFSFIVTCIAAGLLLSHYHLAILYFPGLLSLLITKKTVSAKTFFVGCALLISTALIASLAIFALNPKAPLSWDFDGRLSGWWHHLTRKDYEGIDVETGTLYASAFTVPNLLDSVSLHSVIDYAALTSSHFTLPAIIIILMGFIMLWRQRRDYFWFITLLAACSGPLLAAYMKTAGYDFQINLLLGIAQRQYILSTIAIALLLPMGLSYLSNLLKTKPRIFTLTAIAIVIHQVSTNSSLLLQKQSRSINYQLQTQRLLQADPQSLIICSTDVDCYTLWYINRIDNLRPDVTILSHVPVYSDAYLTSTPAVYPFTQQQNPYYLSLLIAHNLHQRAIFFTSGIGYYDSYLGMENGPFFLQPESTMFRLVDKFPQHITYQASSIELNSVDSRARYTRGIIETISNRQAYAGYLSLKYGFTETANHYLQSALLLDPNNQQAVELIANQKAIIELISIQDPNLTPIQLLEMGRQAQIQGDAEAAADYFRFAYLRSAGDKAVIESSVAFFSSINDITTTSLLRQLLLYNDQVPE